MGKLSYEFEIPSPLGANAKAFIQTTIKEYALHFGGGPGANRRVETKLATCIELLPVVRT